MRLFRALINNTFLILLLLVAVTLYIAFSDSIKKDHGLLKTPPKLENQSLVSNSQPSSAVNPGDNKAETQTETQVKTQAIPAEKPSENHSTQRLNDLAATTEQQPSKEKEVKEAKQAQTHNADKPVTPVETAQDQVKVPTKSKTAPKTEQAHTAQKTTVEKSPQAAKAFISQEEAQKLLKHFASAKDAMNAALKAYQAQDYAQAEKILYVLSLWQPVPDILGALGNVFYKDHKLDWAKRAWAAAANVLIQQGQFKSALDYAEHLKSVAPDLAKQIKQKVQQAEK